MIESFFAAVAELVDAQGWGPCGSNLVEVRVLSAAPHFILNWNLINNCEWSSAAGAHKVRTSALAQKLQTTSSCRLFNAFSGSSPLCRTILSLKTPINSVFLKVITILIYSFLFTFAAFKNIKAPVRNIGSLYKTSTKNVNIMALLGLYFLQKISSSFKIMIFESFSGFYCIFMFAVFM